MPDEIQSSKQVQSVLDRLPVDKSIKAAAFDAYFDSPNEQEFRKRFDPLGLPKEAKAALWDFKFGALTQPSAPVKPAPTASNFHTPQEALSVRGAREAKYGDVPRAQNPMSAMQLTLAAPAAIAAPIPTAVGMGTTALGNYVGLPEWMSVAAGLLTGGLAGGSGSIIRRLRSLNPAQQEKAKSLATKVLPKGQVIDELRKLVFGAPEAPVPVRPNPNIARNIKFGGPTESSYSTPGKTIPRGKFTPPAEPPPVASKPYEPVRPNPNIARKIRFGGASDPYGGRSFKSPKIRYKAPVAEEMEAAGERVDLGDVPKEYQGGVVETAKEIAKNRKVKVDKIADALRKRGVTPDVADAATADKAVRKLIAKEAGYKDISDTTWDHVMRELRSGPTLTDPMPPSKFE